MNSGRSEAERVRRAASHVQKRASGRSPRVALVLGSGLGHFAETLEDPVAIPYPEIPGMPASAVTGHAGKLVLGSVGQIEVVAMQGRAHLYEGHPGSDVVLGARLMVKLGASTLIVTNAAGGIRQDLAPGSLMLIEDHLNLTWSNCLVGPNESDLGERFLDMTEAYDRPLRQMAQRCAKRAGFEVSEGVYAGLLGPTYETPAEIRMLRTMGADAVGMSTVLEVIAARHMGARVLGISCITNQAAGLGSAKLSHEEVKVAAAEARPRFERLITDVVSELQQEHA